MKILHINTYDHGGAGLGVLNLHRALLAAGVESRVLVADKRSGIEEVYLASTPASTRILFPRIKLLRLLQTFLLHRGFLPSHDEHTRWKIARQVNRFGIVYTRPVTSYRIEEHPLVKEADLIHIHWIGDYVNYGTFFRKVNKPIVWTVRDENVGYGGFHYTRDYKNVYPHIAPLENHLLNIKRHALRDKRIHFVALTESMRDFVLQSPCRYGNPVSVIANTVDANTFALHDRQEARRHCSVSRDAKVVMFCSELLNNPRKGLDELLSALSALSIRNLVLLAVGEGSVPGNLPFEVVHLGVLTSQTELASAYCSADLFVTPAFEEAFGKTTIEALFCGTPVVAFPTGIAREVITEENGVRCSTCTSAALQEGIATAFSREYRAEDVRASVVRRFSPQTVAEQYIHLYNNEIKHHHHQL